MERFDGEVLLALTPDQRRSLGPGRFTPVWLCYQLRTGPRLWRCAAPESVRGGVLMASDAVLGGSVGDPAACCAQAVRECAARGARGFWANWERTPDGAMSRLTAALESELNRAGVCFYVNEAYGACTDRARVLLSTALSGGTLSGRIRSALERWGRERLVLAVERMGEDFALPAPEGQGRHLGSMAARELGRRRGEREHRSRELCASYFTYEEGERTHLVLYDTDADVLEKLRLARGLGVERFLLALRELGGLERELGG